MATSSNHPTFPARYTTGLGGRSGAPGPGAPNTFTAPGGTALGPTGKAQQRHEAERFDHGRNARLERERAEQEGQNKLAELTEEQREEINEAVCVDYKLLLILENQADSSIVRSFRFRQRQLH